MISIFTVKFEPLRHEIETALMKKMKTSPYAKMIVDIKGMNIPELTEADDVVQEELMDTILEIANEDETCVAASRSSIYTHQIIKLNLI